MDYYFVTYGLTIISLIITIIAQVFVSSTYSKYSKVRKIPTILTKYMHGFHAKTIKCWKKSKTEMNREKCHVNRSEDLILSRCHFFLNWLIY